MSIIENKSLGEKFFDILNHTIMIVFCLTFVYPVAVVVMTSLTAESEVMREGFKLIPKQLSLSAYKFIFTTDTLILSAARLSITVTLLGTLLNVFVTCMFAYGASIPGLPFKKGIMIFILFTMFFGGGLIPTYLVYKELKLIDNFWVLVLPHLMSPFNVLLIRNYFMTISKSLKESARLDGATEFHIFWRIMLPLSVPILATIALFSAVGYWNDWITPMFFTTGNKLVNLQFLLRKMMVRMADIVELKGSGIKLEDQMPQQTVKMAVVVVATVPIMLVYPFLQKYFVSGIMIGSVKE